MLAYSNARIGIAVISDDKHSIKFKNSISTIRNYGHLQKYPVFVIPSTSLCKRSIPYFFFQKHCTVKELLFSMPKLSYLLVLDADNYIVNTNKRIEEFITPSHDLILSIRFLNNEITAGNYIVKNTLWSKDFLTDWMNSYKQYMGHKFFLGYKYDYGYNFDNGALHYLLLKRLTGTIKTCQKYIETTSMRDYDPFVKCVHLFLNKTACQGKEWEHIKILCKWKSFYIDGSLTNEKWSNDSFILHGLKDDKLLSTKKNIANNYVVPSVLLQILKEKARIQIIARDTGWDHASCVQNGQII